MSYTFRNIDSALPSLASAVLGGDEVGSRVGRTLELAGGAHVTLTHPTEREITIPGRTPNLAAQIAETVWVLAGRNDVGWLSHYLPRARDFSDDGETWRGGYGPRIRAWRGRTREEGGDQLARVIELLRRDPATRRALIQIYDPAEDFDPAAKDLPCNVSIHFLSRLGRLHAQVFVRSNDLWWGWSGINAFEWSTLLEIVAKLTGMKVGRLTFTIGSLHLYSRHWLRAERLATSPGPDPIDLALLGDASPAFGGGRNSSIGDLDETLRRWFEVEAAIREDRPGFEEEVASFREPMLRSWLRVLAWYWTGDTEHLSTLAGTRLAAAATFSYRPILGMLARPADEEPKGEEGWSRFASYAADLHAEKHAVYGDSWRRRGETIGILANVARKIDRLGVAGAGETTADTAIDLLVYLAKYRWFLVKEQAAREPWTREADRTSDAEEDLVTALLYALGYTSRTRYMGFRPELTTLERHLIDDFAELEKLPPLDDKVTLLDHMLPMAYDLAARRRWAEENKTRTWKGYGDE